MTKRPGITTYPSEQIKQIVEELAASEGRSASKWLERWIVKHPKVRAKLNGSEREGLWH